MTESSSPVAVDSLLYPVPEGANIGVDPRDASPGTTLAPAHQPHQVVNSANLLGEGATTVSLAAIFTFLSSGAEHQVGDEIVKAFLFEHLLTSDSGNSPGTMAMVMSQCNGHGMDSVVHYLCLVT